MSRTDTPILICLKIADLAQPHTPSDEGVCWICGAPVWVSKSSPEAVIELCLPCAAPYVRDKGAKIAPLTQNQIDDVIRYRRGLS